MHRGLNKNPARPTGRASLGLALLLGLAPLGAQALGLGALRVHSALGQPLDARIELVGASPGEAELTTIRLAPAEVRQRLGLDAAGAEVTLRFAVHVDGNGRPYVAVSSAEPVREPYVDFVLEARSPSGQVVRRYTALLDPPELALPAAALDEALGAMPARRADPFARLGAPKPGAVFGPVPPGLTLWDIARRVRPAGASTQAVMTSIARANPQAFIDGDPGRLIVGSRLRIPDASALREAPAPPAAPAPSAAAPPLATAPTGAAPTAAPAAAPPGAASPAATAPAGLRVLRGDAAASAPGQAPALDQRLLLLEEALEAERQQNEALQRRLSALEAQLRSLTEQLNVPPVEPEAAPPGPPPSGAAGEPPNATPSAPASELAPAAAGEPPAAAAPAAATPAASPAGAGEPPNATPSAPAPAAPAAASPAEAGSGLRLAAAVAVVGLGGLLLWLRRRQAAASRGEGLFEAAASGAPTVGVPGQAGGVSPLVPPAAAAPPAPPPAPPAAAAPSAPPAGVAPPPAVAAPASDGPISPRAGRAPGESAAAYAEPSLAGVELQDEGLGDPVDTLIDLLTAYVGMADGASARQVYEQIEHRGSPAQKAQAAAVLARLDT